MTTNKTLKEKSKELEPVIRIGKSGLNAGVIEEIIKHLKKKKLIKVKLLRSALDGKDKKKLAEELAGKTNSDLIDMIGFTVTLNKR